MVLAIFVLVLVHHFVDIVFSHQSILFDILNTLYQALSRLFQPGLPNPASQPVLAAQPLTLSEAKPLTLLRNFVAAGDCAEAAEGCQRPGFRTRR